MMRGGDLARVQSAVGSIAAAIILCVGIVVWAFVTFPVNDGPRETYTYQVTLYSNGIPSRTWRSLGEPYPDRATAGVWRFVNAETGQEVAVGGSVAIEHLPDREGGQHEEAR